LAQERKIFPRRLFHEEKKSLPDGYDPEGFPSLYVAGSRAGEKNVLEYPERNLEDRSAPDLQGGFNAGSVLALL
jgi:hypothetical protein